MKLAPLLAEYFYTHHRLDLPGIGSFLLDSSAIINSADTKQEKPGHSGAISFENNPSLKESPDLIHFISSQTGKIKALAAADLDSYLGLVQQFVNIGKPFLVEGIGSLVKIKSGEYAFSSGDIMQQNIKGLSSKEISATSSTEESFSGYKSIFYNSKAKANWRKPIIIILIIAGAGLAIWGGYTVYKITTAKNKSTTGDKKKTEEPLPEIDTAMKLKDSTVDNRQQLISPLPIKQQLGPPPSGSFRFVLEDANAKRAFERFNKLKIFQWPVQMATKDSTYYTLFMDLPATAADTSRIIDSLSMLNGRRVYIEQ